MAKLLSLLLEVTALFDMRTRPELILLQKTMVVVEGVARSFDPKLDIWTVADPVVRQWIERNLGPIGRIQGAMAGAGELGKAMSGLTAIASRSIRVLEQLETMARDGLVLSPDTIAALGLGILSLLLAIQGIITLYLMLYTWMRPDRLEAARSPKNFAEPLHSFTALLPARHEEAVIAQTIERVCHTRYPSDLLEVVVICEAGDTETIAEANRVAERSEAMSVVRG